MPRITFSMTSDENTTFDPELITALKATDEFTDLSPLYEKYGQNEVIEAMFAIDDEANPDSSWNYIDEDWIQDWLWNEYYENYVPYIEEAFRNRHNTERNF